MISKKLPLVCICISVMSLTACYNGKGRHYYPPRTAIPQDWALAEQNDTFAREHYLDEKAKAKEKMNDKSSVEYHRGQKLKPLVSWWKAFDDQTLNKIIEELAENNLDLRIAKARIDQARALQGTEKSDLFPTLDLSLSGNKIGTSHNTFGGTGAAYENYGSLLDASWEIDLFGKNRYKQDAARARTEMFEASYNNVMVTMIAEVATNYMNLRTYQNRLAIARQIMETQYRSYEIVASQNENGLTNDTTRLKNKVLLENARAAIPLLKSEIKVIRNRIAVLLGKNPRTTELNFLFSRKDTVPETSIKLAIGIPADTIRKRPDINMAERKMASEIARVGQKRAELYPSLKLGGTIGLEALTTGSLFEYASNIFGLSSALEWNIFDSGKIRQNLKYQKAVKEESAIAYEKTVINALAEVQNGITRFTNEKIREHNLKQAFEATEKTADIAKSAYTSGTKNFNHYLAARLENLTSKDQLLMSRSKAAIELINLYKALGGGWESFSNRNIIHEE